jgi:DNA-binding Lrp family transcriptional regulator
MELDKIDTRILGELAANARVSTVDLSTRIGLSGTAISRRQKALEELDLSVVTRPCSIWACSAFAPPCW